MTTPVAEFRSAQIAAIPSLARTAALVRSDITAELIYTVIRLWTGHGPMQPQVWMHRYGEQFCKAVTLAQIEAATVAALTIDPLLEEQGFTGNEDAMVEPTSLAGVDGTGRDVLGLAYAAALPLAAGLDADAPPEHINQLWVAAGRVLQLAAHTALLDTSRVAKGVQITGRDRAGWVRMVRPPCCARCAILAGKIGGATVGFQRHPRCDCDAVPVHDYENRADDPGLQGWVFDTREYFNTLDEKQQNKTFTVSGAQAIRDGADPAQVINARRGMAMAKDRFGTTRRVTYESTTSRGWASGYLRQQYDAKLVKRGGRYRRTSRPRLMPEEIYEMAGGDRDKALVLLHKNGYLQGTSASLSGLGVRDAEILAAQERAVARLEKRGAPKSALLNAPRVIHRKAPATVIDTGPAPVLAATGISRAGEASGPASPASMPRHSGAGHAPTAAAATASHSQSGSVSSGGSGNPPGPPGPPPGGGNPNIGTPGDGNQQLWDRYEKERNASTITVPLHHIVNGKIRRSRVEGAHSVKRRTEIRRRLLLNPPTTAVGPGGKTFYPEFAPRKDGKDGLSLWLDGPDGAVQHVLDNPDRIRLMGDDSWSIRGTVTTPKGETLTITIRTKPVVDANNKVTMDVTTAYPSGGDNVTRIDNAGNIEYIDIDGNRSPFAGP